MDGALKEINDNAVDEEGITKEANELFEAAASKGNRDYDSMSGDDELTYKDKDTGKTKTVYGELAYINAVAEDVGGSGFSLSSAKDIKTNLSSNISDDLATKLAKNEEVETADLLKAVYEAKGYTNVSVEDNNGTLTVSASGGGLDEVTDLEVENRDAVGQYEDMVQASAVNHSIASGMISETDAKKYLTDI
jgi:hypothetical protein